MKNSPEDLEQLIAASVEEIDTLAENAIDRLDEILTFPSKKIGTTATVTRRTVYQYAMTMAATAVIADAIGINKETIKKHFARELSMGRAFAKLKIHTSFYNRAVYSSNSADRIFALKNWMGYSDSGMTDSVDEVDEGVEFTVRAPVKPVTEAQDAPAFEEDDGNQDA
jgi:hypothetical protein